MVNIIQFSFGIFSIYSPLQFWAEEKQLKLFGFAMKAIHLYSSSNNCPYRLLFAVFL
jgi:hypothetical protein